MNTEQQKDEELWQMAKARVAFRWSLTCYCVVNTMLVAIWYFSSSYHNYFWPIWPMMGWGIGLAFQYFNAYHGNKYMSARQEYEKLKMKDQ